MDKRDIEEKRAKWETDVLKPALERFGIDESQTAFYTPADVSDFDFFEKVGFPGQYPFTRGNLAA